MYGTFGLAALNPMRCPVRRKKYRIKRYVTLTADVEAESWEAVENIAVGMKDTDFPNSRCTGEDYVELGFAGQELCDPP